VTPAKTGLSCGANAPQLVSWKAIGRYNAKTPSKATAYGKRVFRIWQKAQAQ
jgi:hypothetical protein